MKYYITAKRMRDAIWHASGITHVTVSTRPHYDLSDIEMPMADAVLFVARESLGEALALEYPGLLNQGAPSEGVWVESATGEARVEVVRGPHHSYLRTVADDTTSDNLLELPDLPGL